MKKWAIGIIMLVLAGIAILSLRPGKEHMLVTDKEMTMQKIKVTSSAFQNNGTIPAIYTCDAHPPAGGNPPLEIGGVPAGANTLALIMHDPDAPRAGGWTHWVKFNMKMSNERGRMNIEEGKEPVGTSGRGSGNDLSYQGPCPPSGTHRYFFTVYALDTELSLKEGSTKTLLESAMKGHILGKGELIGLYSRKQ